jgi:hypothetical protein
MAGMLLAALDQTIVSTALPTVVGELGGLDPNGPAEVVPVIRARPKVVVDRIHWVVQLRWGRSSPSSSIAFDGTT